MQESTTGAPAADLTEAPGTASPAAPRIPALYLALMAGPLSFGIAGPALVLDDIGRGLGTTSSAAAWCVTAFGWGIAVGTPLMAGLMRHRGTRFALIACGVQIAVGAALVLGVPVLGAAVAGCALQALGTAGLTSIAMSLAGSPLRMGIVSASLAVVGASAPLAGSLAADALSWRAALALPLISVLGVLAVVGRVPERPAAGHDGADRFDALGALLLTALVTALVFVPENPLVAGIGAVLALLLLGWHIRSRPTGFVPASVVGKPAFLAAGVIALALAIVNFGLMYAVPEALTEHTDWSKDTIGVSMVWPLLFGGALSWFVVAASGPLGRRPVVSVLVVLGAVAPFLALSGTWLVLLVAQACASIAAASGQGILAGQANDAVREPERPAAIGLFNLCYLLGAAFGPTIATLLAG
ncbi:MFS transporter [Streptomyces sp. NPDC004610]|uniref:MFS transporter n=1 Tax=unclassified Streptomyces TaxID=2593676 RepID=UPI00339DF7C4